MLVEVTPSTKAVLPGSTFDLTCSATVPEGIFLPKTFQWFLGGPPSSSAIMEDSDYLVGNYDLESPHSMSVLTVIDLSLGDYTYNCTVTLEITPSELVLQDSATSMVTVRGNIADFLQSEL